jgi:hypothetical protein
MRKISLELVREKVVFFNVSEESKFSKHFWVISTLE